TPSARTTSCSRPTFPTRRASTPTPSGSSRRRWPACAPGPGARSSATTRPSVTASDGLGSARMTRLPLLEGPPVDYGNDEPAMVRYRREGEERALALGNRGPARFDAEGRLDVSFLEAYWRHGFYVLEGFLDRTEL